MFALPAGILASGFSEEMQRHRSTPASYRRVCFCLQVRRERLEEYRSCQQNVWPDLLAVLSKAGWCNYSLFLREDGLVVGYMETPDLEAALWRMEKSALHERWQEQLAPYMEAGAKGVAPLEEILHLD